MDKIQDKEVSAIWDRVKRYIDTNKLEGNSLEEINENLDELMRNAPRGKDKRGSIERLLNSGFIRRLNSIPSHQSELKEFIKPFFKPKSPGIIKKPKKALAPLVASGKAIQGFSEILPFQFRGERISLKAKGIMRSFKAENLRVSIGEFRGKQSFYVYNLRTKKRITWGVVE